MSYNINPCKACLERYKAGNCDINNMNSCVVETAAAFAPFDSNNALRGAAGGEHWHECMSAMMQGLPDRAGQPRDFCNFQLNMAPVLSPIPHYYPGLLDETKDPNKALARCLEAASHHRQPLSTAEVCRTDHAAVEMMTPTKERVEQHPANENGSTESKDPTFNQEAKSQPAAFWITFVIVALLLAVVLAVFIAVLFAKRK